MLCPRLLALLLVAASNVSALPAPLDPTMPDATLLQARAGVGSAGAADPVLAAIAAEVSAVALLAPAVKLASAKSTGGSSAYSSLVAFGASYTDNAHPRLAKYAGSLRNYKPYSQWGGRYCNGPVAVEQLSSRFGTKLVDYAYGGSVIQNGLAGTGSSWPSATDGVKTYLAELKSGKISTGSNVLHYINNGINGEFQLWNKALAAGLSASSVAKAKAGTSAQVAALATSIRSIASNAAVASKSPRADFLLVGIPPLEIVPASAFQIPAKWSSPKKAQALDLLKSLAAQFNSELAAFASQLNAEISSRGGKAFYFDLAALFYDMHSNPRNYGITVAPTTVCYTSDKVCGNPSAYLYFDSLHPTSSVHGVMAQRMSQLVMS